MIKLIVDSFIALGVSWCRVNADFLFLFFGVSWNWQTTATGAVDSSKHGIKCLVIAASRGLIYYLSSEDRRFSFDSHG